MTVVIILSAFLIYILYMAFITDKQKKRYTNFGKKEYTIAEDIVSPEHFHNSGNMEQQVYTDHHHDSQNFDDGGADNGSDSTGTDNND